ncbi:chromosome partitioning protein ParA [Limosilactobacillus reuteri subsp. suis]|uniref:chromosome partitioning protein ParA n=1 Tax=Limosilactobacillus reuteri TaxID=1598 RepID=UPI003990F800
MSNTSTNKTANKPTKSNKDKDKLRVIVGEIGRDTKTGILGRGYSNDNGKTFHVTDTMYGRLYDPNDIDGIWNGGTADRVKKEVDSATAEIPAAVSAANSAVSTAESAVAASKVNSDAIVAQSEAISEAKSAMDSATAEIQQLKANAASDVAQIRADVAQVQNEVDTAKAANSASVDKLKSDIGLAQKDLDNVHDSLTKAQSAVEQNQKLINDSVAKINSDIAQSRQDIVTAQQANNNLAKQLDTYSKEAQEQGKTIKTIQDNQDGFSITIADVKGDVTKVSDTVDGLSAGLKDAQGNIASVKAQADQLNATLTDHSKDIAQLTATAKELSSTLEDADGRLSKVEQTASEQSTTLSDLQGNLTQVKQTADNLVTTLKDAQGNIDQIKQDAKGTLEQLSNVQGDITALQTDVSGIKLTIADHEKNIHTLQADSKTLKDDMADAKGNISSLQKTSTSLVSEFKDHDGRLSKVEQTATEHTSELADTKGNLDKVTQKANALQLLLSDAQNNIQNIQLDAKGLHDTLTGQSNQLTSLNVTLNNLDSKYSGITGDLQSKQTVLSTEQQQTKDMLLNKADKSEVDNVKGTVNQVSAEQKVMADQISQKVSSVEYQTLKDKVNGMNGGGKNLLKGTRDFDSKYWYCSDSNHSVLADNPVDSSVKEIHSYGDWASFRYNQTIQLDPNKNYMISADIAVYGNDGNGLYITAYGNLDGVARGLTNDVNLAGFPKQQNGEGFKRVYLPLNTHGKKLDTFRIEGHGNWNAGEGSVFISKIALYEGNTKQGWEDSSDDLIENIQKNTTAIDENSKLISLMAKQTEVDTVKNTAQQISSRLDILAGEVKSKVDETRVNNIVDGKGYATTSTVQSLVDQKAGTINESITNLTNKLVNNNGGGVNLVSGTIEDIVVDDTANTGTQGWCFNTIPINADLKVGDKITVSVENVTTTGKGDLSKWGATLYSKDISEARANNYEVNAGKNAQVTITVTSMNDPNKQTALLIYSGRVGDTEGKKAVFHHLKVERGEIATPYSQAPSDNATITQFQSVTASIDGLQSSVTNYQNDTSSKYTQLSNLMQSKVGTADFDNLKRAVDMQTLDSADINNMRTNGHYFVRNLANNPIGGWVYVDVTGNGNDRIRQDVYQDSGLKHKYRRWFDTYWTGWEEGATYTEITQLQDAVNLRVQKGELLSQINLTADNTLIQSNKLYLDASSVVITGTAFIPSAAIANLSADKINTGTLNTDKISLSNGHVRLSSDDDHFYVQTEENAINNPTTRFNFDGIDFMDSSFGKEVPQYSIGYDTSSADRHLYINALDHFNSGGATATQNWYTMVPAISLNNQEINFAAKGNMHMQVVDGGVNIKPTLFFQNNTNNGTWAGFTRGDNSDIVEFSTGDNNGENFRIDCGARFMQYVYINGNARAQSWLTNSTLSKKTNIRKLDQQIALDKIRQDDQYLYEYKRNIEQGIYDPQASFIIDDVNDVSHYSVPREFIDQSGNYREPNVELAYLIAAFQAIDKQVQKQKEEIKELKEKLQHE